MILVTVVEWSGTCTLFHYTNFLSCKKGQHYFNFNCNFCPFWWVKILLLLKSDYKDPCDLYKGYNQVHVCVFVTQSCRTLCDPMDCSPQAPLSMKFSRQKYWSGFPFPSPGVFPNQGSNLGFLHCRQMLLPSELLHRLYILFSFLREIFFINIEINLGFFHFIISFFQTLLKFIEIQKFSCQLSILKISF